MNDKELLTAITEHNDALRGLRDAVFQANKESLEVKDAIGEVVNHSHLRSTLNLLGEDFGLRRLLDLTGERRYGKLKRQADNF